MMIFTYLTFGTVIVLWIFQFSIILVIITCGIRTCMPICRCNLHRNLQVLKNCQVWWWFLCIKTLTPLLVASRC